MNRTCNKCNWVHFSVSREYAESEVKRFNEYYLTLTSEEQNDFYGGHPATIELYSICNVCGNSWDDFRESMPGDCPDGCTLGPIIYESKI